jgi:hypothetical protein
MKTLSKVGRPESITPDTEVKLESIFKIGGTNAEACAYAGIAERTYYSRRERDEKFVQRMDAAQHYADIVAKNVVVDNIIKDKNIESAKWWLEKRVFKDNTNTAIQINFNKVLSHDREEYKL